MTVGDMIEVYCVFRLVGSEQSLWKIFGSKEKAEDWINTKGNWSKFEIEKWQVH